MTSEFRQELGTLSSIWDWLKVLMTTKRLAGFYDVIRNSKF